MEHTSSFDIKTANDFYEKMLLPQYEEFIKNNSSSRHALLSTILAYHMYEWVHEDCKQFSKKHFLNKYPSNEEMYLMFDDARQLTNGIKHFNKKGPATKRERGFDSGFGPGFARTKLIIKLSDDREISADDFLEKLVGFWNEQREFGGV